MAGLLWTSDIANRVSPSNDSGAMTRYSQPASQPNRNDTPLRIPHTTTHTTLQPTGCPKSTPGRIPHEACAYIHTSAQVAAAAAVATPRHAMPTIPHSRVSCPTHLTSTRNSQSCRQSKQAKHDEYAKCEMRNRELAADTQRPHRPRPKSKSKSISNPIPSISINSWFQQQDERVHICAPPPAARRDNINTVTLPPPFLSFPFLPFRRRSVAESVRAVTVMTAPIPEPDVARENSPSLES